MNPFEMVVKVLREHRRMDAWDEVHKYHFYCEGCLEPPVSFLTIDEFDTHIASVVMEQLGLTQEQRTLADGMGGISTNYETGVTTVHGRPCTRLARFVTPWMKVES